MKNIRILCLLAAALCLIGFGLGCATPKGSTYGFKLNSGDEFKGTLESTVQVMTGGGAVVEIPSDNISEMLIGPGTNVRVELRDRNEVVGIIQNETLSIRLDATGKVEDLGVGQIKRFEAE